MSNKARQASAAFPWMTSSVCKLPKARFIASLRGSFVFGSNGVNKVVNDIQYVPARTHVYTGYAS